MILIQTRKVRSTLGSYQPSQVPPQSNCREVGVFLKSEPMLTHKARNTTGSQIKTSSLTYAKATSHPLCMRQSRQADWFHSLPFQQFQALLTLFSKFFSSFPHGTCSLSVSRQYLALEGIYLPFWSAFPNKPTLGKRIIWSKSRGQRRDFHPL